MASRDRIITTGGQPGSGGPVPIVVATVLLPIATVGAAWVANRFVPGLRNTPALFVYLGAIVVCMRFGGWAAGLVGTILSGILITGVVNPPGRPVPGDTLSVSLTYDLTRFLVFVAVALMMVSIYASRSKTQLQLKRSEERLSLALESAHMGVWDYNLLTRQFWWSPTLEQIYGRTDGTFATGYGRFFAYIHFDDQPLFNRAITRTIDEGTDYEVEHRVVLPDGSTRRVQTRGRVFFNTAGRAERIVGIAVSVIGKPVGMFTEDAELAADVRQ